MFAKRATDWVTGNEVSAADLNRYENGIASRRETVTITTASLAANAVETGLIPFARAGTLLKLVASHACRLRIYATAAARTADAARAIGTDPSDDLAGLIKLDAVLPTSGGNLSLNLGGVTAYNADDPVAAQLYYAIENRSAAAAVLTATLTFLPEEV